MRDIQVKNMMMVMFMMVAIFTVNFQGVSGQTDSSMSDLSESVESSKITQPIIQKDDTKRVDPLNHWNEYKGGFDMTNKHYWSSTVFTGIYGYAIGLIWLLIGVIYGTYLLCKRKTHLNKRTNCHNKHFYLWPILIAALFTTLAIGASGLVLGGNAKFNSRAREVVDIVINTANEASQSIFNTTGVMKGMEINLGSSNVEINQASSFLASTSNKLNVGAANIERQARKNRLLIDKGLKIVYAITTATVSLNLIALLALTVSGLLRFRRALHMLIILCWFLTFLCWVLFGLYYFLDNFASDTCTALENFQQNPTNNSLTSILPCDELLSAESILSNVSAGIYNLVNEVNANISVQQSTPLPSATIPYICNPFSGPPDYHYMKNDCPSDTIRIGDIPKVLKLFTCSDSGNGTCKAGEFISSNDYKTVEAYTGSIQKILNAYPNMQSLIQCQSVKDAFSVILVEHCKPLKRYVHIVWAGLVFLSIVMVGLVLIWCSLADQYHQQEMIGSLDGSVKALPAAEGQANSSLSV